MIVPMRYHFTTFRMAIEKKMIRSVSEVAEKMELLHAVGNVKWCTSYGEQYYES